MNAINQVLYKLELIQHFDIELDITIEEFEQNLKLYVKEPHKTSNEKKLFIGNVHQGGLN